ncbi:single-stranded DNA-binding protein [Aliikangiella marina]|uniref:Single-stranded DNA-binding protein n=1 Tax=Aliikangiella marina TaxID=1712262 RepID=A0A545T6K5_9GAMM|nr:single-stranded DNA-binding protein [Aliikangiella marina]TQV72802.1 single-stranded DNA-binding protein [Aliikangiella marina]
MSYFRADAHLMAQLVDKDVLRYSVDNIASLLCVFKLPGRSDNHHFVVVMLFDELAEKLSRADLSNNWYEIKGRLNDRSPEFKSYRFAGLSIRAVAVTAIPPVSKSFIQCELIGRLTRDPEHVVKGDDFEFDRFSIAVNRNEKANFFDVSVFKPRLIKEVDVKLTKGQPVYAAGELTLFDRGQDSTVHGAIKLEKFVLLERQIKPEV